MPVTQIRPAPAGPRRGIRPGPATWVALGALAISTSAVLVALAAVSPATAAFHRCVLALLLLGPLAAAELRRRGRIDRTTAGAALLAGVLLGVDFLLWNASIPDVGAGVATVLVNLQVVVFPVLVAVLGGQRVGRRFLVALPVLLLGVALAGGILDGGTAPHPVRGTVLALAAAVAYSGYLLLNRRSGERAPAHLATPVFLATCAAGATAGVAGALTSGIAVDLPAMTWLYLALLAVLGQVAGWLLIARGLPRVAPAWGAALLLLQPVGSVVLGMTVLGEEPAVAQLCGCALVLATVWLVGRDRGAGGRRGET